METKIKNKIAVFLTKEQIERILRNETSLTAGINKIVQEKLNRIK